MNDEYDEIIDFLDEKLRDKEYLQFQKRIKKEPELREKLILMKMLRMAFNRPEHMEFLSIVENAHREFISKKPPYPASN